MIRALRENSRTSESELNEAINLVIEKVIAYCRTPDAEDVLPKCSLFVYGYGFGTLRENLNHFFTKLGFQSTQARSSLIPKEPIRDLFGEAATKYDLPFTPNALTLSKYKNQYLESVQAQFVDMGLGPSTFYGSLCLVYERFQKELEKPYQKNPLLIVISDGQIDDGSFNEVIRVTDQLKGLGVQVIHCYTFNGHKLTF